MLVKCKQCGTEFQPPPMALHKKFCCVEHRNKWHGQQRKRGLNLLAEAEDNRVAQVGSED